jgi:hypothetical protein
MAEESTAYRAVDKDTSLPRLKLGEVGFTGLRVRNKQIIEETNRIFQFPQFCNLVHEMRLSPPVATALNAYKNTMNRSEVDVVVDADADDILKERAEFIKECLHDMQDSWQSTMSSFTPYLEYGFGVHEIVLRRRLKRNGSKYNDGLVGLAKIAPRHQDTIVGWVFDESGNNLLGVQQSLKSLQNPARYLNRTDENGRITIPRDKFILITADATKNNPEGNSILKPIYLAYKHLSLLQDQQLLGVAKDIQGILKIAIPPRYLSPDADSGEKAVADSFKTIIDNYNNGTQAGLLVPQMLDPETKQPLFSYDLLESKGVAKFDIEKIINRLQQDILTALSCDAIKMDAAKAGSFSLQDGTTNMFTLAIAHRLSEIADALNTQLVRTLFEMNGWDTSSLPRIVFKDISSASRDEFSSFVQRVFSVGGIEIDRDVMNKIREVGGFPLKDDDAPIDYDNLSTTLAGKSSSAAEGLQVGVGNVNGGTSTSTVSSGDTTVTNTENKP